VRYAYIEQNRDSYPLQSLCAALQVSDSGFAAWQWGEGPKKWLSDRHLLARIREIHEETKAAYGSPRIYQELKGRGIPVSKGRVERLMRENGLRGRHKRRFKATTDSKHSLPVAPNRLDQNFETERPDQVWTADITYLATGEGWLYLAIVLDLYTRQIVGWAMRERMTKDLVIDALRMAWFRRRPRPGLIHHSDRGRQYCSHDFQKQLADYGMLASMSRKGNCWDNAPSESFFNSLKNERVHGSRYETRDEARADVFEYVEVFYNRSRRHSSLGGQSPASFYETWLKTQLESKLAA
jgi:putative transposase